ncbi:hypothetical protein Tco_0710774 [Tanacetum coccineum]
MLIAISRCLYHLVQGTSGLDDGTTAYRFAFVDCVALQFWVGSIIDDASAPALGPLLMHDNAFNGMDGGDLIDHIAKVLEITEWIKIPNVGINELRLHVFSKSLSGDAKTWWNNEINETTITWSELNDKFFHKYYPSSQTCNSRIPDDLDNGADYLEFTYWLASKFDNYLEIDKNTKNGLWEFYVNQRTNGTIGDLDEYKEPCKKTCSDTFYKPYLDAQDAKDIYEVIDREYSPIPIPSRHDIDNPNDLCRTKEFTIIRHSIGTCEEFITVDRICTYQRYSVVLPEKLKSRKLNVYRSARSPLKLVTRFPDHTEIETLHDNFV